MSLVRNLEGSKLCLQDGAAVAAVDIASGDVVWEASLPHKFQYDTLDDLVRAALVVGPLGRHVSEAIERCAPPPVNDGVPGCPALDAVATTRAEGFKRFVNDTATANLKVDDAVLRQTWSCIVSRAHGVPSGGVVLLPGADLMNHNSEKGCVARFEKDSVKFIACVDTKQGEQVYHNYSGTGNSIDTISACINFGFLQKNQVRRVIPDVWAFPTPELIGRLNGIANFTVDDRGRLRVRLSRTSAALTTKGPSQSLIQIMRALCPDRIQLLNQYRHMHDVVAERVGHGPLDEAVPVVIRETVDHMRECVYALGKFVESMCKNLMALVEPPADDTVSETKDAESDSEIITTTTKEATGTDESDESKNNESNKSDEKSADESTNETSEESKSDESDESKESDSEPEESKNENKESDSEPDESKEADSESVDETSDDESVDETSDEEPEKSAEDAVVRIQAAVRGWFARKKAIIMRKIRDLQRQL